MSRLRRWTSRVTVLALLAAGLPALAPAASQAASSSRVQPKGDGNWTSTPAPKPQPFGWRSPAGKNLPLVKTDPHAKRVRELTDRRTRNASFFQMSDGSVQEELSAVPVNYQDAHGAWQPIDPSVKSVDHAGFTAGSVGNSFQTYFGSTASSLVRVEQGGGFIQVGLDGAHVGAPQVSGDTVSYPGVLPGTDLSYQSGPDGLTEKLVLTKPPAAGTAFSFTIQVSGFTPKRLADGAIAFYGGESANPVFTIPAPYMSDAKPDANSPYGVAYSAKVAQSMTFDAATGTLHVSVKPDASWLASSQRVYPVTVDPTIVVSSTSSTAANVMILQDGPTTNYDTSWRLSVGTTTTGAARALIKFALPTVPAGTTVTSADLQLYYDQTFTTGSNNVPMQALAANAAWDPTTATWNNASSIGGSVAGTTQMTANQLGVWNDFPVTSTVQSWLNGTLANNGFVLKATSESTLGKGGPRYEGAGYYYNGEVKNYPKLVINYGVPGVTVNPPTVIHSTGAELSWPAYANNTGNTANDLAEYQVHRSIYQTFTPTASTEISPVASGTTNFVDSTAVPTPANNSDPYGNAYYYMVVVKTKSGQLIPGPTTVVRLPEAGRTTLLIPAQSATTLSSAEPTTVLNTLSNAGTPQPWLEVGDNSATYGTARSVFNFPSLSAVPSGSTVLDAHLKLWQETTTTTSSGAVYQLHALTRAFTGSQATWDAAATGTNWTTAGGDFNATADGTVSGLTNDPNRQNLDATSIVQGWVKTPSSEDGLLVKLAAETSTSPQERTIFAGPNTAEPALVPTLVVTYLDTSTGSTYYAPSTPTDMNPGTTYSVPVTINNTTASTWAAASEVLTYHWTLPDGTDLTTSADQLQTALPSDLAPAATVTLNAQVTPPTPTDGNQAEGATLAWDMYNKTTGTYLSGGTTAAPLLRSNTVRAAAGTGGTGSLQQQVSVDQTGNNQLGLESFYPYVTAPTGSGSTLYTNTASGNSVWNDDLFSNPSVGQFDTTLRLSYNSLSTMDTSTGFGWSIEASAPIRLGQPLQFHPQTNPTSIVMVDGTGNAHQWNWNSGTNSWDSPPGVHLFLQGSACKPQDTNARAWKMTRPDRTTYYFDCEGYPTAQIDPNGNQATFSYTSRQSQNKPEEFLDEITDPLNLQTLTLTYFQKGDASYSYIDSTGALVSGTNLTDPAIIDHVKSITDISGRTVDFYYTSQGLLGRVVDGAGTGIAKTFNFTYDATQGMKNVKLVTVQDPRLDNTAIAYYPDSSPTKWWTQTVTDRTGNATGFAYVQPGTIANATTTATVTDANNGAWVYDTDSSGRLIEQVAPAVNGHSATTTIGWDTDNNISDLTEDNGAHAHWVYDKGTGFLTSYQDALAVKNNTAATTYSYALGDDADTTLTGHIGFLDDVTSPMGRRTHYTYYPLSSSDAGYVATAGYAGNIATVQAPDGTANGAPANSYITTYGYDMYGQVETVKDANGHTTTYDRTFMIPGSSTPFPEPTGLPRTITDPLLNSTQYVYNSVGDLTSVTDPSGHTGTHNYDVFSRPLDSQTPKDQANNVYVVTPAPTYDGNDNVTSSAAPYITGYPVANSTTYTVYDKDDRPLTVTLPANNLTSGRVATYSYDKVGNQVSVTEPAGNPTASPPTYTTTTHYDAVDEPISVTDAANDTTQYGYDSVGNRTTVTDPLLNQSVTNYDADHEVTGTKDAAGNTTSVAYDLDGVKLSSTDQNGDTASYTVDADGQITQVQVPHAMNSSGTAIEYDVTQYTYDQVGNNTAVISPKGVAAGSTGPTGPFTSSTQYDNDNRVSKVLGAFDPTDSFYTQSQQPQTDYSYDVDGRVQSVDRITQPNPTTITPIGLNPVADHAVTSYAYYDNGWTKSSSDPFALNTQYDYNGLGQQISRTVSSSDDSVAGTSGGAQRYMNWLYYPDGSLQNFTDTGLPNGWQDQVITADSGTTEFTTQWTAPGQADGYGGSTYYTNNNPTYPFTWNLAVPQTGDYQVYAYYSASGDSASNYVITYNGGTQSTPPLGQAGTINVDQTKNIGSWVPLGNAVKLTAGTSGQKVVLKPSGGTVPAVADAIRIVCTDCAGTSTGTVQTNNFTYKYDANGDVSDITDTSPNAQFDDYKPSFNNINQIYQLVENKSGAPVHTLTYQYDAAGNLTKQTQDTNTVGAYTYNNLNQLQKVTDTQFSGDPGVVANYTYYPNGQLHTETKGNKNVVTDDYNYDDTLASSTEATSTGTTVDSHILSYDSNNNIVGDNLSLQSADGSGATLTRDSTLTYSPNNQVTAVTNGQNDQTYQYDSSGDVINQTVNGASQDFNYTHSRLYAVSNASAFTGTYEYDTLGRLQEVVGGNVSGYTGAVGQQYSYDGFDNILSQSQTSGTTTNTTNYTYDSLNRAITEAINPGSTAASSETIDYVGTSKTVADENITAGSSITDLKTYDYSPTGERLALLDTTDTNATSTSQTAYYTYSPHQDVEALTGSNGATVDTYGYTAYGADDTSSKTLDSGSDKGSDSLAAFPFNSFRFNAARISTTTGNLDMGARTYDPNTNGFLSRDAYNGSGANSSLAGGSAYGFAGGNPISNVELDGHSFWSFVGGLAATAAVIGGCALAGVGTAGIAAAACAVGAGVAGGLASQGVNCAEGGGNACSAGSFAVAGVTGAVAGAVGFGVGSALTDSVSGWAAGAIAGASASAAGYGAGCALGSDCSWSGLAESTLFGGALGAGLGAAFDSAAGCGESFTADTTVEMADGSGKPISEIQAGDEVKSADTSTGKTEAGKTSAVLVNHDTDLYDLTVHTAKGDQVVHTTAHHQFFDLTTHTWVEASKLHKGDQLATSDGSVATVEGGVTPAVSSGDMWDLTVPGDHDFYVEVGGAAVLVHNCGGVYDWADGKGWRVRYRPLDELNRPTGVDAMVTKDMLRGGSEAGSRRTPGWRGDGTAFNEARGHLLAARLGGRGKGFFAKFNLVTLEQTPTNSPLMRDMFEQWVFDTVDAGESVQYSVTPEYEGTNPIPIRLLFEAYGSGGSSMSGWLDNPAAGVRTAIPQIP